MFLTHVHVLVTLMTTASLVTGSNKASEINKFKNVNMNDVVFTQDLMFRSTARSMLECSAQCSKQSGCLTFTFSKRSPLGSCQGHFSVVSASSPKESCEKSRTFAVMDSAVGAITECPEFPIIDWTRDPDVNASRLIGSRVAYTCFNTFLLMKHPDRTAEILCQDDGTWTRPTFSCAGVVTSYPDQDDPSYTIVSNTIDGKSGVLVSPGYPQPYPRPNNRTDVKYTVQLYFPCRSLAIVNVKVSVVYQLTTDETCLHGHMTIVDPAHKYCGTGSARKTYEVVGCEFEVRYNFDASYGGPGFILDYSVE